MMLQPFLSIGVWFFFFVAVEHLGERSLAVINLARTLSTLPFIIIHAFATATNSLVSNLIGEDKTPQVPKLIRRIMLLAHAAVIPLLLLYALCPEFCLRICTDNQALIDASVEVTYVVCASGFLQIGAFILFNAVSGTGAVKTTVLIETLNLLIYVLFVWLVIIRGRPSPAAAWSAEIIYQAVTAILCLFYFRFGRWREKRL
jgi:Na+-driven multidrug efflux pump